MNTNWPLLSLMRFLLASIVAVWHISDFVPYNPVIHAIGSLNAFAAVAGFFVISGYSISHSIHRKPEGYLSRRIDRIYPAYLAALAFSVVMMVAVGGEIEKPKGGLLGLPTREELVGNALMMQQFLVHPISVNIATWSLAIEEVFYLCAPLLMRVSRRAVWAIIATSLIFFLVLPAFRDEHYSNLLGLYGVAALAWMWLLGWQLHTAPGSIRTRTAVMALICAGVGASPFGGGGGAVATVGATAAALMHGGEVRISERWQGLLTWMGNISYPLYIVHMPVCYGIWAVTQSKSTLLYLTAVLLASLVIHHGVELPFRKYRRWQQGRAQMPVPLYQRV